MVFWWFIQISATLALEGFLSNTLIFSFLHWFSQTYQVTVSVAACTQEKNIYWAKWKMTKPKSARGMNTFQFNYVYIKSVTFNILDEHKVSCRFHFRYWIHLSYLLWSAVCFSNRGVRKSHLLLLILAKFKLIISYFITEAIRISKQSLQPLFFLQFCSFLNEKMSWMEQLCSSLL